MKQTIEFYRADSCSDYLLVLSKEKVEKEIKKAYDAGYEQALDDTNTLHGDAAERFLKKTGLDKVNLI